MTLHEIIDGIIDSSEDMRAVIVPRIDFDRIKAMHLDRFRVSGIDTIISRDLKYSYTLCNCMCHRSSLVHIKPCCKNRYKLQSIPSDAKVIAF